MKLTNMSIDKIITHQIYKTPEGQGSNTFKPKLSNKLLQVDKEHKDLLKNRVTTVYSKCIEMVKNSEIRNSFDVIKTLIKMEEQEFIETSQKIATSLCEKQTTRNIVNSSLLIITGQVGFEKKHSFILIIKADLDDTLEVVEKNGHQFLRYITNSILGKEKKLYKLAIIIDLDSKSETFVYDSNINYNNTKEMARYFYSDFLGCKIKDTSKKQVEDFFDLTNQFLMDQYKESKDLFQFKSDLQSYIANANIATVDREYIVKNIILSKDSDSYMNYMNKNGFPEFSIVKDIEYFSKRMKFFKIRFSNGVYIKIPSQNKEECVEVLASSSESVTLTIKGNIIS